ncbi:hypothetical protein FA95DRAFT_1464657, partial [Auriscalpium vulgare]
FDDADADLILRSSDLTDFRVLKAILIRASPVLKAMLSPSHPPTSQFTPNINSRTSTLKLELQSEGPPILSMPEDAETLASLLSLALPVQSAIPETPQRIVHLLDVAQKYEM